MWSAWLAWATYFRDVCGLEIAPPHCEVLANYEATTRCGGPYSTHPDFAMVSDRPVVIRRDAAGRLHGAEGPAIEWRDGWNLYFWHGLRIPRSHEWVVTHKDRIRFEAITKEPNAELRRVMFEIALIVDPEIMVRNAHLLAEDALHGQPRRLFTAKLGAEEVRLIEVRNGTIEPDGTRRKFHLGAMPGATPHEVVAASYGRNPAKHREAVRT